jgi:endo-1,4-beta-xylanase
MFQKIKSAGFLLTTALIITCCQNKVVSQNPVSTKALNSQIQATKGLKDYFSQYFPIGVAVNIRSLKGEDSALIVKEFNSITPENDMKIGPIHPAENQYNFANADAIVAFAQRNNLKVRGHNLVWHFESQTPKWIFKDKDGNQASKELVLQRLKDHITTVVSRYKGKLYAWDVANEVISDKPDEYMRPSEWYKICGEDYIIKAFQWAHEVDPDAQLFYNDYNEISPVKREKIYRLVKSLKDAGVPIHGVGLQAHWAVNEPSRGQLDSTLKRFADLGLKIQITELDISVYPKEHDARERRAEDAFTDFTAEREQAQTEKYKMCFELFKKYRNAITSVTFWNLSDRYSWLDNFPVRNRKDYPLLFDQNLKPKKAYWEVVKIVQ